MSPFELFLLELAKVLQFSGLAPDEKGACLIIMKEGKVPLLFEYDEQLVPNTVLVSSLITAFPIEYREDFYEAILRDNHRIEETLSVKPDEDTLFIHRRFHPSLQEKEIDILLKDFLATIKRWHEKVKEITSQPPRANKIPPHPSAIKVFPYKA